MRGFTADWLDLREPADAAARAESLVAPLYRGRDRAFSIVDLATGTGANLRWLAPRLQVAQKWIAIDHDQTLLTALATRETPVGAAVDPLLLDLARDLAAVPFATAELVTASALLDLVSGAWLKELADRCATARADVLFALTYAGRTEWDPREAGDDRVRDLLNRHQLRDKGFGPALGPAAAETAASLFRARGYDVLAATSDWHLGHDAQSLQRALVSGWLAASIEMAPDERALLERWADRRCGWIDRGASRLVVGHVDFAGRLRAPR